MKVHFRSLNKLAIMSISSSFCIFLLLISCSQNKSVVSITPTNDIITFSKPEQNKIISRVSVQTYINTDILKSALEKQFPDHEFIFDYTIAAGDNTGRNILSENVSTGVYDFVIATSTTNFLSVADKVFVDISSEPFVNKYLLSSVRALALNDHLYAIPGPYEAFGIAYNKDLFNEHGWKTPNTADEFFSLCKKIKKETNIRPFATDWKYNWQIVRMLQSMTYKECFGSPDSINWYNSLIEHKTTFSNHAEPMFDLAKRLFAEKIITEDDFTASMTKQRMSFFDGQIAMLDYGTELYGNAKAEDCPFKIDFIPYPAVSGDPCYISSATILYAIPKASAADKKRLSFIKSVFEFLSTTEGQRAEIGDSMSISNLIGYSSNNNQFRNIVPLVTFTQPGSDPLGAYTALKSSLILLLKTNSIADSIKSLDNDFTALSSSANIKAAPVILGTARKDFSMLETSYYLADKMKEIAGSDFAVMLNGGYFRSNISYIKKGNLTADTSRFIMQGIGAHDYLTVYKMTGKQIKECIEHPVVNGAEVDQFTAVSGLAVTYAPWSTRGNRLLSAATENGTALEDSSLYTVAAYPGVVSAKYISGIENILDTPETLPALVAESYRRDKNIAPDIKNRVTLVWN